MIASKYATILILLAISGMGCAKGSLAGVEEPHRIGLFFSAEDTAMVRGIKLLISSRRDTIIDGGGNFRVVNVPVVNYWYARHHRRLEPDYTEIATDTSHFLPGRGWSSNALSSNGLVWDTTQFQWTVPSNFTMDAVYLKIRPAIGTDSIQQTVAYRTGSIVGIQFR